jgi:short-subunit dehydrogenase
MSEYNTLAEELKSLDIAILDLNAGVLEMSEFSAMSDESLETMINCNALHPLYLTKALMAKMLARELRSAIIIMSSVAGCYEHPGVAGYCASKAITNLFAKSLSHEVKEKIDVMSYAPAMTSTPMMPLEVGAMGGAVVSVEESVSGALKDLGHTNFTHGCKKHKDFHDANHPASVDIGAKFEAMKQAGKGMVQNEK